MIEQTKLEVLLRFGVALALGLLMGLERGWERRERPEGSRVAGFRTFGLISLLGGVTAYLGAESRVLLLTAVGLALAAYAAYSGVSLFGINPGFVAATANVLCLVIVSLLTGKEKEPA